MIKEIKSTSFDMLKETVEESDIARNYFILLGLNSKKKVYDKVYGEYEGKVLKAALFIRKSGLLQLFMPGDFDLEGFTDLINSLDCSKLIGPGQYCHSFFENGTFATAIPGAYIAKLGKCIMPEQIDNRILLRSIGIQDLDEIVKLYDRVFDSFSSKDVMETKLSTGRGRGICIEMGDRIVSVAQSDFETKTGALIVGVATDPGYRNKGLATLCTEYLSGTLQKEGKDIYLQYDNPNAGKIYDRLGFKVIDRVIHYSK